MVRRRGPRLTLAEKTELWRRWRRGESLNAIGRALGRIAHVVRYEVARTGGIPPPATPAFPPRAHADGTGGHLPRPSQRYVGATDQPSAAPGPVDRESGGVPARRAASVSGGHGRRGGLGARPATQAVSPWRRTRPCVTRWPPKLTQKWSPQQIAGWLRRAYPDDPTMHVSHETIYLSLFVQSRGVLKKALQAQLRQRRTISAAACRTTAFGRVHRRGRLDSGAPRHRRGPRRPGALGGRSPRRRPAVLRGDAGRAVLALRLSRPCVGARDRGRSSKRSRGT